MKPIKCPKCILTQLQHDAYWYREWLRCHTCGYMEKKKPNG